MQSRPQGDVERPDSRMVKDPVCGMIVDPPASSWVSEHNGVDYYFCSEGCQREFVRNPTRYVGSRPADPMGHRGYMGGCCGVPMGRGWMSYLHLGLMILLVLLLLFR